MALFESYERRIKQIDAVLNSYGIASIEEAEKIAASEERMRQLIEEKKPISELRPLFRARYK